MKIIFSRKGFDSSHGGYASPIFPDGTLFSVPIPDKKTSISYKDLKFTYEGEPIQRILNDLTNKKIRSGKKHDCDYFSDKFKCHFDPMIFENDQFNGIAFGQEGASASHLINQKVQEGDIFLFYGWFKEVEKIDNKWQYKKDAKDLHVIWGYMEVGKVLHINNDNTNKILQIYPFLAKHPHIEITRKNPNIIFISKNFKRLKYNNYTLLSDIENYKGRSYWKLPSFFNQPQAFTYVKNFIANNDFVNIKAPYIGQEFVLDLDSTSEKGKILEYIFNFS
ncbi:hypothetical protein [Nitratiruptor tergarcus]|nr:hypothetical protein [Nitratiruptor tergarcus]